MSLLFFTHALFQRAIFFVILAEQYAQCCHATLTRRKGAKEGNIDFPVKIGKSRDAFQATPDAPQNTVLNADFLHFAAHVFAGIVQLFQVARGLFSHYIPAAL